MTFKCTEQISLFGINLQILEFFDKRVVNLLYVNKITLRKIKDIICADKIKYRYHKQFIDELFKPLHIYTSQQDSFVDRYIGTHISIFMNGNYCKNKNGDYKRDSISNLKLWAEKLTNHEEDAFHEMLNILDEIYKVENKNNPLDKNHRVFKLIDDDLHDMPNSFVNYINLCMQNGDYLKTLLMMIFWSIYGRDEIENLSKIYDDNEEPQKRFVNKSVRLLSYIKPCRPVFKGRDKDITDIHEHFQSGNKFIFLKGMGGIGKSECAKQYARKYQNEYDVIIFAECNSNSIVNLVNDNLVFRLTEPFISERIKNLDGQMENDFEFYQRKLAQIKSLANSRMLVIVDNMDWFDAEIETLIAMPFHMIVTTRWNYSQIYPQDTKYLNEIRDMSILKEIFSEYYGKDIYNDKYAENLITMFDGHTMAIELVSKQMKASYITPKEMIDIFNKNAEIQLEEGFIVSNYDGEKNNISQYVQKLFNIASLNSEEKYILMCLSLMPLSGIEKKIFKETCGLKNYNAINKLAECSWINDLNGNLFMHTLVKETVQIVCNPDFCKCIEFAKGLVRKFPAIQFYYVHRTKKDEIEKIVTYIYNTFPEPVSELYDFYEWIELIFSHCAKYDIQRKIIDKLLSIYKKEYGDNHFRTARMIVRMGCLEKDIYNIERAIELLEQGKNIILNLKDRSEKETLYISDINIVISNAIIENYELFKNDNSLDKVEKLNQEIISIRQNFHGTIDLLCINLAIAYRSLAWVEIYRHNCEKVFSYLENLEQECNKIESFNYVYYLKEYIQSKLALELGDLNQAILHMINSMEIHKKYFGEYNVHAIRMNVQLGDIYKQNKNIDMSKERYQQAIEFIDKSFIHNENLRSTIVDKINHLNFD